MRPTADRVREALFSILGDVAGLRVLDLFCGTGALGIEAISRGAASVALVDRDPSLAARNLRELEIESRCELVRGDAIRFLACEGRLWDLVLCDPPYGAGQELVAALDRLLPSRLTAGARIAVESAVREPLELSLPVELERRYGSTLLRIHVSE